MTKELINMFSKLQIVKNEPPRFSQSKLSSAVLNPPCCQRKVNEVEYETNGPFSCSSHNLIITNYSV
jgi:hypothetical protein